MIVSSFSRALGWPTRAWLWFATLSLLASQLWILSARAELMPDRQWTIFSPPDGPLSSDIHTLLVAGPTIWVGTASGVSSYDGRWTSYATLLGFPAGLVNTARTQPFGEVTALAASESAQQLWAGTRDGRVARWDGGEWHEIADVAAPVHALAHHADQVWVGTERGLLRITQNGDSSLAPLGEIPVYALALSDDHLWVGTQHGLWEVDPASDEARPVALHGEQGEPLDGPVSAIWVEGDDRVWLGMERSVIGYRPSTGETSTKRAFTSSTSHITGLTGTPGASLWVTSDTGLAVQYLLRGGKLANARIWDAATQDGFEPNSVRDVVVDQDQSVWLATDVALFRYQPWAWRKVDLAGGGPAINDTLLDSRGRLWVATVGKGVWTYAGPDSTVVRHVATPAGLRNDVVCALAEDSQGGIWAGTVNGVARYDGAAWTVPIAPGRLPSPYACTLQPDGTGMWIGTARGLARYSAAQQTVQVEIPTEGHAINDLAYDSRGRLWVATADGQLWQRTAGGQWLDTARRSQVRRRARV